VALTTGERDQVWRAFMRVIAAEPCSFTKQELRAAVDAVDDWATANATAYNTALPTAFKNAATANQKAALLGLVCWLRAGRPLPEGQ